MLRPGERNRLEEGINYFPAGAPRRTLFFTLPPGAGPGLSTCAAAAEENFEPTRVTQDAAGRPGRQKTTNTARAPG